MSREHLYKAKRANWRELPKDKWWVEGYFIEQNHPEYHAYIVKYIKIEIDNRYIDILEHDIVEIEPETICEYTGLIDRKNMKIFENDIFHIGDKNIPYFVEWHNTRFTGKAVRAGDRVGLLYWNWRECIEIMGNLHDNPELLKGDEAE